MRRMGCVLGGVLLVVVLLLSVACLAIEQTYSYCPFYLDGPVTRPRTPSEYFGFSLTAINTLSNVFDSAIGAPHTNYDSFAQAGSVSLPEPSQPRIFSPNPTDFGRFGYSLSFSNDSLFVGAPGENSSLGAVHIFTKDRLLGRWNHTGVIIPSGLGGQHPEFGFSVASRLSGNQLRHVLVVGAPIAGNAIYVYESGNWTSPTIIQPPTVVGIEFGHAVDTDALTIVVGAPYLYDHSRAQMTGIAFVYRSEIAADGWQLKATLSPPPSATDALFGWSVAVSQPNTIAIGAPGMGSVFIFEIVNSVWQMTQQLTPADNLTSQSCGISVSISNGLDQLLLIGCSGDNSQAAPAYIYFRDSLTKRWTQSIQLFPRGEPTIPVSFGLSVSFSNSEALVSAPFSEQIFSFSLFSVTLTNSGVWDGPSSEQQRNFQASTNLIETHWRPFTTIFNLVLTEYLIITTLANRPDEIVLNMTISRPDVQADSTISISAPPHVPLIHNTNYTTTVRVIGCIGNITATSPGFLVDATPPVAGSIVQLNTAWGPSSMIKIKTAGFSDPESGIDSFIITIVDVENDSTVFVDAETLSATDPLIYYWHESPPYGSTIEIRLSAVNRAGLVSANVSAHCYMAFFNVTKFSGTNLPELRIGRQAIIEWLQEGLDDTKIRFSLLNGTENSTSTLLEITPFELPIDFDSFIWEIPSGLPTDQPCYLLVSNIQIPSTNQIFGPFVILPGDGFIDLGPIGSQLSKNHTVTIKWSLRGAIFSDGGGISIELLDEVTPVLSIANDTVSASDMVQEFQWLVPTELPRLLRYRLRLISLEYEDVASSSGLFEIDFSKDIKLLPLIASSDYLIWGKRYTLHWNVSGSLGLLQLNLSNSDMNVKVGDPVPETVGQLDLQFSDLRGQNFFFRLYSLEYPNLIATSDAFEIDEQKSITVQKPSENTTLSETLATQIQWTSRGRNLPPYVADIYDEFGDVLICPFQNNISSISLRFTAIEIREFLITNPSCGQSPSSLINSFIVRIGSSNYGPVFDITPTFSLPIAVPSSSEPFPVGLVISLSVGGALLIGLCLIVCLILVIVALVVIGIVVSRSAHRSKTMRDDSTELMSLNNTGEVTIEVKALDVPFEKIEIVDRIGRGSYGEVFKARYQGLWVAVKRLDAAFDTAVVEEFKKEALTMAQLNHPKLLQFIGICASKGVYAIVTEFMEKGSLDRLMRNEALSWTRKIRILSDIASGMAFIHSRGFAHRDLKSGNVLINESYHAKVADFGQARFSDKATTMTERQGTPAYMAPEVISSGKYDNKCDVYSFGILLCEVLTEREPYHDVPNKQGILFQVAQDPAFRPTLPLLQEWDKSASLEKTSFFELYLALTQECWNHNPEMRPSFDTVVERVSELSTQIALFEQQESPLVTPGSSA